MKFLSLLPLICSIFYFIITYTYCYYGPTGIHFIRQTDTLSFILNYYNSNNFNFFELGNLNLNIGNGNASCEFPLFYFLFGKLFRITGINFFLVRLTSLILICISIYISIKKIIQFSEYPIIQIIVFFLLISSSVFRYYSSNYLPDSIALSFCLISVAFGIDFYITENQKDKNLKIFLVFGILSSLMKIYYGIYFGSLVFVFLYFKKIRYSRFFFLVTTFGLVVGSWYFFSLIYNILNNTNYYLTASKPLWSVTKNEIQNILSLVMNYWKNRLYFPSTFHLLLFMLLVSLFFIKRWNFKCIKLLFVIFVGAVLYGLIFFGQFKNHDYYFLVFLPFFLLLFLFLNEINQYYCNFYFKIALNIPTVVITILSINYSTIQVDRRYSEIDRFTILNYKLTGILQEIKETSANDKFLIIGDVTQNGGLVFINRYGYTFDDFRHEGEILARINEVNYLVVVSPYFHSIPKGILDKLSNAKKLRLTHLMLFKIK